MDNSQKLNSLIEFAEIMWPRMQAAGYTYNGRFLAPDVNGNPRPVVITRELGPWLLAHSEDLTDEHWAYARSRCAAHPKERIYRMERALIHTVHGSRPLRGALS